jgi:hypothetical protein
MGAIISRSQIDSDKIGVNTSLVVTQLTGTPEAATQCHAQCKGRRPPSKPERPRARLLGEYYAACYIFAMTDEAKMSRTVAPWTSS